MDKKKLEIAAAVISKVKADLDEWILSPAMRLAKYYLQDKSIFKMSPSEASEYIEKKCENNSIGYNISELINDKIDELIQEEKVESDEDDKEDQSDESDNE